LEALNPDIHFSKQIYIAKSDAEDYSKRLKAELTWWNANGNHEAVQCVFQGLSDVVQASIDATEAVHHEQGLDPYSNDFLVKHFLSFLLELKSADRFPAVVFCLDEGLCEKLVKGTLADLEAREEKCKAKENSGADAVRREKERKKVLKAMKRLRDKKQKNKDEDDDGRGNDVDMSYFDDEESSMPDPRFSFVQDFEHMDPDDFEYWLSRCLYKTKWSKDHPLIKCLYRGIGIHHGALPKAYRSIVETLFRGKHLKVVVSTHTLAMGINMPCRTVCFAGDLKLTPLLYRQMSGRAGRRGYDDVGYVVFYGVPGRKAFRLVKSPIAHLSGYFPVSTNLVLRIMMYVNSIGDQDWALDTFKSLLEQPFHLGSEAERKWLSEQARFHFRFSLHYLHIKGLLGNDGKCKGMANLINHMDYQNCSIYPFVSLMEGGILDKLCMNFKRYPAETAKKVVSILAHFFHRIPLPASARANLDTDDPSLVVLPPLPKDVQAVIDRHNTDTVQCFTDYMRVFCRYMSSKDERFSRAATQMPLSKHYFPPTRMKEVLVTEPQTMINELWQEAVSVSSVARSPFVAMSNNADAFDSLEEMAGTVHGSIRLDAHAEPTSSTRDLLFHETKLNAYAVDVFTHRNVRLLMKSNMLDDKTAWLALKNWVVIMNQLCSDMEALLPEMDPDNEPKVYKCFKYIGTVYLECLADLNKMGFQKR